MQIHVYAQFQQHRYSQNWNKRKNETNACREVEHKCRWVVVMKMFNFTMEFTAIGRVGSGWSFQPSIRWFWQSVILPELINEWWGKQNVESYFINKYRGPEAIKLFLESEIAGHFDNCSCSSKDVRWNTNSSVHGRRIINIDTQSSVDIFTKPDKLINQLHNLIRPNKMREKIIC